ncbi:MAG: hypothetical protein ABW101_08880 [Candidatus Thiodiazotropha sp.]
MKSHVEFRSDLFPPYDGEEEQINPGRFGKRVAEFIIDGLKKSEFKTEEPIPEDWGWVIPIENQEFNLWIGCGNYEEYPNGFLCFIEPHNPEIRKFPFCRKISTANTVNQLREAMSDILSNTPGIDGIKWYTHDEFNNPSS